MTEEIKEGEQETEALSQKDTQRSQDLLKDHSHKNNLVLPLSKE